MAKSRYHIGNNKKFVEFPFDAKGLNDAKKYRKEHPEFKHRRIRGVLQCYPSQIQIGKEYFYT